MSWMSTQYNPDKHSLYIPKNPEKYLGKGQIVTRSSWEMDTCRFLDLNDKVLSWASEPGEIQYFDTGSGKKRRYFPDYLVKIKNGDNVTTYLVEVKPFVQTQPPKFTKRKNKINYLNEQKTFATNISKWKAAKAFCIKRGWKFLIITERELYGR